MLQDAPATATRLLDTRLLLSDGTSIDMSTQLHYDANDPYAVTVFFLVADDHQVEWVLSRDLLRDGLHGQAGHGDVRLRPLTEADTSEVELVLLALTGRQARVIVPTEAVTAFLHATDHVVPPGTETQHLDIDSAIQQILSS